MGAKKAKPLATGDIHTLSQLTGLDVFTVQGLHNEFQKNSKDGLMSKKQFRKMYSELTPGVDPESSFKLKRLADRVFKAFDHDQSGNLSFDEFSAAYLMLKTQGSARSKMEFLLKRISDSTDALPPSIDRVQARALLTGLDAGYDTNHASFALESFGSQIPTDQFMEATLRCYEDTLNRQNI